MADELFIEPTITQVVAEDDTPQLEVENELNEVAVDEMENAYRYELWRCLTLLQQIEPRTENIEDSLETITQSDVQSMWS